MIKLYRFSCTVMYKQCTTVDRYIVNMGELCLTTAVLHCLAYLNESLERAVCSASALTKMFVVFVCVYSPINCTTIIILLTPYKLLNWFVWLQNHNKNGEIEYFVIIVLKPSFLGRDRVLRSCKCERVTKGHF